jgi:hypothetical protein
MFRDGTELSIAWLEQILDRTRQFAGKLPANQPRRSQDDASHSANAHA